MEVVTYTNYRVLYADTDQMGVVYYGNYPKFYEIGRTEMVRELGFTYKQLEDEGIFMPVSKLENKYISPIYYDELITIKTTVDKFPQARMFFKHEIFNAENKLVHTAVVTLVFLDAENNRPTRAPQKLIDVLEEKMNQ